MDRSQRIVARYLGAASSKQMAATLKHALGVGADYQFVGGSDAPHQFTVSTSRFSMAIQWAKPLERAGLVRIESQSTSSVTFCFVGEGDESGEAVSGESRDPVSGKVLSGGKPAKMMLEVFDQLNEKGGSRFYVTLADMRDDLRMSKSEFDRVINTLRRDLILTLNPAEGRHENVPQRLLDAGINENNRLLVYAARREH